MSRITCQTVPATTSRLDSFRMPVATLIPAYNEGRHLDALLDQCRALNPTAIVVVDDGSTDATPHVLARQPEHSNGCRLVWLRQDTNKGKQAAVKRGLRYIAQLDVEAVALIDADLQHDPAELPALAELLRLFDVVIGARLKDAMPLHRRFSNWVVNRGFSKIAGVDFKDVQSGLRLYQKPVADALGAWLPADGGFGLEHESLTILAKIAADSKASLAVAAAPIGCRYADETSHIGPMDVLRLGFETVRQALRFRQALALTA